MPLASTMKTAWQPFSWVWFPVQYTICGVAVDLFIYLLKIILQLMVWYLNKSKEHLPTILVNMVVICLNTCINLKKILAKIFVSELITLNCTFYFYPKYRSWQVYCLWGFVRTSSITSVNWTILHCKIKVFCLWLSKFCKIY